MDYVSNIFFFFFLHVMYISYVFIMLEKGHIIESHKINILEKL